jgi:hypothetical protein
MNETVLYGAIAALFTGLVGFGKYTLTQKDAKIKELEAKNHDLVERLLKSRGKK